MGDQIRLGKLSNQRCRIIPYVYREVYNFRNERSILFARSLSPRFGNESNCCSKSITSAILDINFNLVDCVIGKFLPCNRSECCCSIIDGSSPIEVSTRLVSQLDGSCDGVVEKNSKPLALIGAGLTSASPFLTVPCVNAGDFSASGPATTT